MRGRSQATQLTEGGSWERKSDTTAGGSSAASDISRVATTGGGGVGVNTTSSSLNSVEFGMDKSINSLTT